MRDLISFLIVSSSLAAFSAYPCSIGACISVSSSSFSTTSAWIYSGFPSRFSTSGAASVDCCSINSFFTGCNCSSSYSCASTFMRLITNSDVTNFWKLVPQTCTFVSIFHNVQDPDEFSAGYSAIHAALLAPEILSVPYPESQFGMHFAGSNMIVGLKFLDLNIASCP